MFTALVKIRAAASKMVSISYASSPKFISTSPKSWYHPNSLAKILVPSDQSRQNPVIIRLASQKSWYHPTSLTKILVPSHQPSQNPGIIQPVSPKSWYYPTSLTNILLPFWPNSPKSATFPLVPGRAEHHATPTPSQSAQGSALRQLPSVIQLSLI